MGIARENTEGKKKPKEERHVRKKEQNIAEQNRKNM